MLAIAAERFDRRLAQEIGSLRIDMAKEFASVRTEMARMQTDLVKWSLVFWVGQLAAVTAIVALLLKTIL